MSEPASSLQRRILEALLPQRASRGVLIDLDRELAIRMSGRAPRWTDTWWVAREAIVVAAHMSMSRLGVRVSRVFAREPYDPRAERIGSSRASGESPRTPPGRHGPLVGFGSDLRLVARGLIRSPGLSLAAILVLALGVAAPTSMYSIMSAFSRDLPLPDSEQLVGVRYTSLMLNGLRSRAFTPEELAFVRAEPGPLGTVAAYAPLIWDLRSGDTPERVNGARVTHDFFDVLGVEPVEGRDFAPGDEGEPVALASERLWRERFGADPDFIGSTLRLNGELHTIVGIVPKRALFPEGAEIWVPIASAAAAPIGSESPAYSGVARLPEGATLESIAGGIDALESRLPVVGVREPGASILVRNLGEQIGAWDSGWVTLMVGMLTLVSLLLLVAAANVANLFLCRAVRRHQDLAVRVAMGASRARIVCVHLAEAGVVALIGGGIGIGIAVKATQLFRPAAAAEMNWWMEVKVDGGMLAFALALVGVATLVGGVVPALYATRNDVQNTLRGDVRTGGGFRLSRLSEALVVTEVMFSVALLIPAFLVVRTLLDWRSGGSFETGEVLAASYALSPEQRSDDDGLPFHRTLLERVAERPGVVGAALMSRFPGQADTDSKDVRVDGTEPTEVYTTDYTEFVSISPGAFDVLDVPIMRGRDFTWNDGSADSPAVIVNEAFARRFFGDADPLGKRIRFRSARGEEEVAAEIVGMVPVVGTASAMGRTPDAVYLPVTMGLSEFSDPYVLVRAMPSTDPLALLPQVREALATLDSEKPLYNAGSLRDLIRHEGVVGYVFGAVFIGSGLAGLLMAGIGLYTVMAFAVSRRTREAGVRMALGSSPARLVGTLLKRAAIQLGQGLFLGLAFAVLLRPVLESITDSQSGTPFWIYGVVTGALLIVGMVAALVPTLRCVSIQPTVALRAE